MASLHRSPWKNKEIRPVVNQMEIKLVLFHYLVITHFFYLCYDQVWAHQSALAAASFHQINISNLHTKRGQSSSHWVNMLNHSLMFHVHIHTWIFCSPLNLALIANRAPGQHSGKRQLSPIRVATWIERQQPQHHPQRPGIFNVHQALLYILESTQNWIELNNFINVSKLLADPKVLLIEGTRESFDYGEVHK